MDLSLDLQGSVAIVTGGVGQIGSVIVDAFLAAGCFVGVLDIAETRSYDGDSRVLSLQVDTCDELQMIKAWEKIIENFHGVVPTVCVAAAGLDLSFIKHHQSVVDMPVEQFRNTLDVNLTGTFITAKTWLTFVKKSSMELRNVSLILIGSESGIFGVPGNPDYAASKAAIQYGLMLSLTPDAARVLPEARVNAIAPGAVATPEFHKECSQDVNGQGRWLDSEATVASRKPIDMEHVAKTCLMLASDKWSGSTTGQIIRVDGGKSGKVFWTQSGDASW